MNASVFSNETCTKHEKVWENEKVFPYLVKNRGEIEEKLTSLNIKKVRCFDQISNDWEVWRDEEQLVLAVLPIAAIIDEGGKRTEQRLKDAGLTVKKNYYCVDISTKEIFTEGVVCDYFQTRNLIVAKANIFSDDKIWNFFAADVMSLGVGFMTKEKIEALILENQYRVMIQERIDSLESDIKETDKSIEDSTANIMRRVSDQFLKRKELQSYEKIKEGVGEHIRKEIEECSKLPFVKEFLVCDKIYASFGNIYITTDVKTEVTMRDGIKIPKMERKQVLIGDLQFIIGGGRIDVKNRTYSDDSGLLHPHANDGQICFGEAKLKAETALHDLRLKDLLQLLYSWAISYNAESTYTPILEFYEKQHDISDEDANNDEEQEDVFDDADEEDEQGGDRS